MKIINLQRNHHRHPPRRLPHRHHPHHRPHLHSIHPIINALVNR